ncbi:hypothetical protein ACFQ8Q_00360 [Streptomyces cyaneofuscatus]|uniref:hypothetical protein n=1 Tax=Streptomyces cyaneofuscatus TaxID=66883 RepID=UPI0036953E72
MNPFAALISEITAAEGIARTALDIVTTLDAQPMDHSPNIRAVYARVRQLAHLATDAADHLIAAEDVFEAAFPWFPAPNGDGFTTVPTEQQAREESVRRHDLVAERLSLGAVDAVAAAELYVADRRFHGHVPEHRPPALSSTQSTTLRAIARGEVTIRDGRPSQRHDDIRVSISTVRSLESRGLAAREPCQPWLHDERVQLTADGRRGLAAAFGRPRPSAPTTVRPPSSPVTSAVRSKAR